MAKFELTVSQSTKFFGELAEAEDAFWDGKPGIVAAQVYFVPCTMAVVCEGYFIPYAFAQRAQAVCARATWHALRHMWE